MHGTALGILSFCHRVAALAWARKAALYGRNATATQRLFERGGHAW